MKLDYMQCWNGAMEILRTHKEAVLAIAGVFIFLPTLLMAQFTEQPQLDGTEDMNAVIAAFSAYFNENAFTIISSNLLISFGGLALYFAVAPSKDGTVADDLSKAIRIFIFFLLANILVGLATLAGFMALIIPGLYLAARFSLVPVVIADQQERNPIEALKKSWDITKDNGFSILLLILMIAVIGAITIGVVGMLIGVLTGLATGGTGWPLLQNLVSALTGTAFQIVLTVVIVSIYAQLTGKNENVGEVFS